MTAVGSANWCDEKSIFVSEKSIRRDTAVNIMVLFHITVEIT